MNASSSAYYSNILKVITITLKMVYLSSDMEILHSSIWICNVWCYPSGNFRENKIGVSIGRISIELLNKYNNKEYETKINLSLIAS